MKKIFSLLILILMLSVFFVNLMPDGILYADTIYETFITTHYNNYTNTNSFATFNDNYFLLNQNENLLIKTNEQDEQIFSESGGTAGKLYNPTKIFAFYNGNILISDQLNRLQIFDENLTFVEMFNTYQTINDSISYHNLGEVSDFCIDFFNTIYCLDYTNNLLLVKQTNADYLQDYLSFTSIDLILNQNSKIAVSPNGSFVAILVNSNTLLVHTEESNQVVTLDENYDLVKFDCGNSLFLFKNNAENSTVQKLTNDFELSNSMTLNSTFKDVILSYENGNVNYLTNSGIVEYSFEDFTQSATEFDYPINFLEQTYLTNNVIVGRVNTNTELYSTPFSITTYQNIFEDDLVLILSLTVEQNETLYFCLYEFEEQNVLAFIKKTDVELLSVENSSLSFITFYKNVKLHKYPTANSPVLSLLNSEEEIVVLNNANNYTDAFGNEFYTVQTEFGIAYVNQAEVINVNLFEAEQTTPLLTDNNQNQAIAFALILASLLLLTTYLIYSFSKKKPEQF